MGMPRVLSMPIHSSSIWPYDDDEPEYPDGTLVPTHTTHDSTLTPSTAPTTTSTKPRGGDSCFWEDD